MSLVDALYDFVLTMGFSAITWQEIVMLLISFVLIYLALVKGFEPLLLLPIAFGMLLANTWQGSMQNLYMRLLQIP